MDEVLQLALDTRAAEGDRPEELVVPAPGMVTH
jgi:hypothetical protein